MSKRVRLAADAGSRPFAIDDLVHELHGHFDRMVSRKISCAVELAFRRGYQMGHADGKAKKRKRYG